MNRAEKRRAAKVEARIAQYKASGFKGSPIFTVPKRPPGWGMGRSKYVPHIGAKEIGRYANRA